MNRSRTITTTRTVIYHIRRTVQIISWMALATMLSCGLIIWVFDGTNFLAWMTQIGFPASMPSLDSVVWFFLVSALITLVGAVTGSFHHPDR